MRIIRKIPRKFWKLVQKFQLLSRLKKPTESEILLIEDLRNDIRALYSQQSDSTYFWNDKTKELAEDILTKDPRNFTNWVPIRSTMFYENPDKIELDSLGRRADWEVIKDALREDLVGNPKPYWNYRLSSGNLVHHAYSVSEYLDRVNKTVDDLRNLKTILEFGGGYGSLCRLLFKLGFSGQYIIFDLPQFSALQKYFLKSINLPVRVTQNVTDFRENSVNTVSDLDEIKEIKDIDLFIGLWSISETPESLRESILYKAIDYKSYLIAYQHNFMGIDNLNYFKKFAKAKNAVDWHNYTIDHIQGQSYLIGSMASKEL